MKVITGKARYKKESRFIYNTDEKLIFDITKVYITTTAKSCVGVYPVGSREYRLSLVGTEWDDSDGKYKKDTVCHDSELIILELYETVTLPLTDEECYKLVDFIKEDSTRVLQDFLDANIRVSNFPIIDLSTSNFPSVRESYLEWEQDPNARIINADVEPAPYDR